MTKRVASPATTDSGERLVILQMVERHQITAEQAVELLDSIDSGGPAETLIPDATVEEDAWMLTALLQVTEAVSSPVAGRDTLNDMLARVVRIVPLLAGVDRCAVFLRHAANQAFSAEAWYPSGKGETEPALGAELDENIQFPLVLGDEPDGRCALLPMTTQGTLLGVMQVEYLRATHSFGVKELAILTNIAIQVAVGVENMRLREEAIQGARLERELQLARDVQMSLLPATAPVIAGWQIASHWQPANAVAGDFFDFVSLGRGLGVVVADVAGKGMAAALFMALARAMVRASTSQRRRAGGAAHFAARVIERANRLICQDAHDGMFVTLFFAVLESGSNTVSYTSAGNNPPLLVAGGQVQRLEAGGMALGLRHLLRLPERAVELQPGDALVMYTDGLTEAIDSNNEQFGLERLMLTIQAHHKDVPHLVIDAVMQAVASFVGSQSAFDDATIVVARRCELDEVS